MSHLTVSVCALAFLAVGGCTSLRQPVEPEWKQGLRREIATLGYQNWVVIADASFPAHSRRGVRVAYVGAEVPEVVDGVLQILEETEHLQPRVYVPRELRQVENNYAPGIEEFRPRLEASLHGRIATELEQASLMTLLEDANKTFDILVVKTATAMPYSSVFLELQPGYWDGEAEMILRKKLVPVDPPEPSSPRPDHPDAAAVRVPASGGVGAPVGPQPEPILEP